jgi:hypothetical protein
MNPAFFKGTIVEKAVEVLIESPASEMHAAAGR